MIEIEVAGTHWFGISRIFASGAQARNAYVALGEYDRDGRLDIGIYRHQRVGLDSEPVLVTIVGLRPETVEEAGKLIEGSEVEQHPDTWLALIARRVRFVLDNPQQGHHEVFHDGGATLTRDGRFIRGPQAD